MIEKQIFSKISQALVIGLGLASFAPAPARAGLIDCKVILCLAGGFPTGCADAYSYMMDRISRRRPLPPFGTCHTVSLRGESQVYDAARGWLGASQGPTRCVATAPHSREEDGGWCTRQCTDVNHNVNLRVTITGQEAYSASYTYARSEHCENLNRSGRSADGAR